MLRKRQQTFSLEKCIQKHGKERGTKIWKERQEKWQETLNSKSDEEKLEINKKKLYKNGMMSKSETQLYNALSPYFPELEQQKYVRKDATRYYAYDIALGNKIIEYNGDYWHANPNKYSGSDIILYPRNITKKVSDIWQQDQEKIEFAKSMGYDVLVIWESDFTNNKKETLEKCRNFLMG